MALLPSGVTYFLQQYDLWFIPLSCIQWSDNFFTRIHERHSFLLLWLYTLCITHCTLYIMHVFPCCCDQVICSIKITICHCQNYTHFQLNMTSMILNRKVNLLTKTLLTSKYWVFYISWCLEQVQIGNHSFTFDHVYGNKASPASSIFDECVSPLLEGLFQGYNATVLAYGQVKLSYTWKFVLMLNWKITFVWRDSVSICVDWLAYVLPEIISTCFCLQTGSGKTYTMGTGYTVGGSTEGVIPKVMAMIYKKVASLKSKAEFQIRVSFIEVLVMWLF